MIKSFRGLIASGGQETIRLRTNNGMTGYKIHKLQLMQQAPMTVESESVLKIFTVEQDAIDGNVDFSNSELLAAGFIEGQPAAKEGGYPIIVVFDHVKINQDIFITHSSEQNVAVNYYIELEQMKLSLDEATVATLKDMRGSN